MIALPLTYSLISLTIVPISKGSLKPTVSGKLIVLAPASITASLISFMKPISERPASSQENSTSSTKVRAYSTALTALLMTSSGDILSLCSICILEVAIKVWIRFVFAFAMASPAALTSESSARAKEQMVELCTLCAIFSIASKSPGLAAANPASMISTPKRSNCTAIWIFSSVFMEAPGLCSPSLKVVSNILIVSVLMVITLLL